MLLNYAPAGRGLVDTRGHAVTSRFIPARPTTSSYSLETLWALLNSPIANAYAYSHLGKRDNLVGEIRKIPVPKVTSFNEVERAVSAYLAAASSEAAPAALERLLMRVDREVLNLYSLPIELEKLLLGLFNDWKRVGVPFAQTRYLPKELEGKLRFSDFLEFEENWSVTNREKGMLIDKSISGVLNDEERMRLHALQDDNDYHIEKVSPRPTHALDELENRLFSVPTKDKDVR